MILGVGDTVQVSVDNEYYVGKIITVSKKRPHVMIDGISRWFNFWECKILKFASKEQ